MEDPLQANPPSSSSSSSASDIDGFEELLGYLPPWVQDVLAANASGLEEVAMDIGRPLAIRCGGNHDIGTVEVTKDDLRYLTHRLGGFRDDNRAGIERTLHRISAIRDRYGEIVGVTIRLGRFIKGVADLIKPYLERDGSLMLIGPPGVGKTTLLRDVVRVLAEVHGPKVVVVDTSSEIGGDGRVPHPGLGSARRMQVPEPSMQAKILQQALTNHGPSVIIADEIGYHDDVAIIETTSRRGVRVVATVHGKTLNDVMENPMLWPLLGNPDKRKASREARPVFRMALEVRAKGVLLMHESLERAVDALLVGDDPGGVKLGNWPETS